MAKKKTMVKLNPLTGEETLVFKGFPKTLLSNPDKTEYQMNKKTSLVEGGLLMTLQQMDLAQNTGWRTIYNSMGFKSTELNRALYNAGTLVFFRSTTTGRITYMKGVPVAYHDTGVPSRIEAIPVFRRGGMESGEQHTFSYGGDYDDCVLWHDTLPIQSVSTTNTPSRSSLNLPFLDLSAKILQKMERQLILSGTRLVGLAKDSSSIPIVQDQLQHLIQNDDIVQVVSTVLDVDTRVLSMNPELLNYMQVLQDLNQYRQYVNGFGQGQFGTFKKERALTGEIEQNEGNTNLIHMARTAFDAEFCREMKRVFNEDIFIEYNGANMGGRIH